MARDIGVDMAVAKRRASAVWDIAKGAGWTSVRDMKCGGRTRRREALQ